MQFWSMIFRGASALGAVLLWTSTGLAQTRPSASQPATQNSAATVSDVSMLVGSGQYAEALRAINRLLPGARGGGTGQDRHELLMLRAEAQLHLKNHDSALITLEDLAQQSEEAADIRGRDQAIAFATLIRRSSNFAYVPKTQSDKSALNILEPQSRASAYAALFSDELASLHTQEASAQASKTLAPLLDIAREFAIAQAIERTASGDVKQTSVMARELSKWATTQIESALDNEDARITRITSDTGRSSSTGSQRTSGAKRGLDPDQEQTLTMIVDECRKIPALTQELNKAFGQTDFAATVTRAKAIGERASTVLEGGYAPPVKRSSRSGR